MYDKTNRKALMVHLFGIKFADVIRANGYKAREIIETAGIGYGYQPELQKGMNLSKHVDVKKELNIFDSL